MRVSRPVALLSAVGVALSALGATFVLVSETIRLGGPTPKAQAALVTTMLVVVGVFAAVLLGAGGEGDHSTPYW